MAKQLIVALALVGYGPRRRQWLHAPSAYNSPSAYAPSAPAEGYGVPDTSYGAPTYGEPASGYGAPVTGEGEGELFSFDKLFELLPFFVAVFAALILAQLLQPLLALLPGVLMPFGNAKIDLINFILAPFSLAICNTVGPTIAGTPGGRSFQNDFTNYASPDTIDAITNFLFEAIDTYQKK